MRGLPHALLVGALAGLAAGAPVGAGATEWSLNGSVGQSFQANSNPGVEVDNDGATFGSVTRMNVALGARTKRTSWSLSSGAAISQFGGPGATDDLNTPNPTANGAVRYRGQRLDLNAAFGFSRASTSFLEFNTAAVIAAIEAEGDDFDGIVILPEDDLLIERESIRTLYSLSAGANYTLTPRTSLQFSGTGAVSRFSETIGGLIPNSSFGFATGLDHRLDPVSRIGVTGSVRSFKADDFEETRGLTFSFGGSYSTQLTRATGFNVGLGAGYTIIRELQDGANGTRRGTETDLSFDGGFGGSYRPSQDTSIRFSANHSVRPSSDGELVNVTSFGASANFSLTSLSALSLAASHSVASDVGGQDADLEQSFVIGPTLSYQFAPDWSASLGYTFRLVDDDLGTATGSSVFLGVTRSLSFFP
ncbi:MAG: hypothetical protein AAF183_04145 [Pseudomonadota bacterium]